MSKSDAKEDTREELSDKKDKVKELEEKIDEKDEKIQNLKDKDQNFENLREKKEEIEKEKEEAEGHIGELEQKLDKRISKVRDDFASDKLMADINRRAGGDEDLAQKMKEHYDSFKGDPEDEKEREERLDKAETLATGSGQTVNSSQTRSGVGTPQTGGKKKGEISDEGKEFGKEKFGLEEDDFDENNE